MARSDTGALFRETQAFDRRRLAAILAALPSLVTALAVAAVFSPRLIARLPTSRGDLFFFAVLLWIVFAWLIRVKLVVEVDDRGLNVRLRGVPWRERVDAAAVRQVSIDEVWSALRFRPGA